MPTTREALRRLLMFKLRPDLAILLCFLLGMFLPAAYGLTAGIPEPKIHDEFSYLLAADTFAHGRLTNATPEPAEFFEAEHILVEPTYMSKYPPAQGLVLAAGQALFGHPIWGVWLGCGCFAASLCWMLQAWTSRPWALATTVAAIASWGVSSYWAQSYWGGSLAACGGALLFGGLRRTLRHAGVGSSLLMGLGVVILASSRPFEGLLACVVASVVLTWWLFADSSLGFSQKFKCWLLPFGVIVLAGGTANAIYNRAVTGDWTEFPYSIHQREYFHQGNFVFSEYREPQRQAQERIAKFYFEKRFVPARGIGLAVEVLSNLRSRLFGLLQCFAGRFELHVEFGNLLWVGVILCLGLRSRWAAFCCATVLFVVLGESTIHWWLPHYSAPIAPLVIAIFAEAFRRMSVSFLRYRRAPLLSPLAVVFLAGCSIVAVDLAAAHSIARHRPPRDMVSETETPRIASRQDLVRWLGGLQRRQLVFVRYDDKYGVGDEWVYNDANLSAAPSIFAHDLGDVKNRALIRKYADRSVWLVTISKLAKQLMPYPSPNDEKAPEAP